MFIRVETIQRSRKETQMEMSVFMTQCKAKRKELKIGQWRVNLLCRFKTKTYSSFERGRAVPTQEQVTEIQRVLFSGAPTEEATAPITTEAWPEVPAPEAAAPVVVAPKVIKRKAAAKVPAPDADVVAPPPEAAVVVSKFSKKKVSPKPAATT